MNDDVNPDVQIGILGPAEIWKDKDLWVEREQRSQEGWSNMKDEERQATLDIVDHALDRLRDRLEVWVPSALKIEQGKYMDVTFRILFTELEQEMRAKEEITQRKIKEAASATEEMVRELEKPVDG